VYFILQLIICNFVASFRRIGPRIIMFLPRSSCRKLFCMVPRSTEEGKENKKKLFKYFNYIFYEACIYKFYTMSGFDPQTLARMGIEETLFDFRLPLYARYQMSRVNDNGLTVYHAQPRPLSEIALIRLIFQIVDHQKFIRYLKIIYCAYLYF